MLRKDVIRPLDGTRRTADPAEVERFDKLANEWWAPDGRFKTVHAFNAARVGYIGDLLSRRLARPNGGNKLSGLRVLDVGCGAGLVAEPISRLGATVTAIDASAQNVEIARRHALKSGLDIDYLCATPEEYAPHGETFDAVLSLEVVEHVADLPRFLAHTAAMVRPGGTLVIGTLNRTALSFALAIIGAEYVLRWLPRGTHDWRRFVTPEELATHLEPHRLAEVERQGVRFNPLHMTWQLGKSTAVNYLQVFTKREC